MFFVVLLNNYFHLTQQVCLDFLLLSKYLKIIFDTFSLTISSLQNLENRILSKNLMHRKNIKRFLNNIMKFHQYERDILFISIRINVRFFGS